MNHLDLFSGIGGFSLGLQQAGIEPDWIGYSDIDKYANQVFKRRFPNAEELGSITTINTEGLPDIDLVTFGFPCQDLSMAGKRGGLNASRSGLFFKALEIIADKKPTYFVFENVRGLLSSNKGEDFKIVLQSVSDIGYDGQWQLLNTRWFLPQNRERVYFVGHIRGECRPKVFPIGEDDDIFKPKIREEGGESASVQTAHSRTITSRIHKMGSDDAYIKVHSTHPRSGDPTKGGTGPLSKEDGTTYCLDTGNAQAVQIKSGIRRFTPLECERLQGFPDNWTEGHSDTQRYKQCGNAVTVPVVEEIMRRLYA